MGRPRIWRILSAANAHAAKQKKSLLALLDPCFASPIETAIDIIEIELPPAKAAPLHHPPKLPPRTQFY